MSPHLKIYKFETNMISSVVFRGTGIAMSAGKSGAVVPPPYFAAALTHNSLPQA
jgi:succinate dehydrogenase/fumarate reductase cytochrome b subunit